MQAMLSGPSIAFPLDNGKEVWEVHQDRSRHLPWLFRSTRAFSLWREHAPPKSDWLNLLVSIQRAFCVAAINEDQLKWFTWRVESHTQYGEASINHFNESLTSNLKRSVLKHKDCLLPFKIPLRRSVLKRKDYPFAFQNPFLAPATKCRGSLLGHKTCKAKPLIAFEILYCPPP